MIGIFRVIFWGVIAIATIAALGTLRAIANDEEWER